MVKILDRLKEITSYYSFGRILGYIAFKETIGIEKQLVHGLSLLLPFEPYPEETVVDDVAVVVFIDKFSVEQSLEG